MLIITILTLAAKAYGTPHEPLKIGSLADLPWNQKSLDTIKNFNIVSDANVTSHTIPIRDKEEIKQKFTFKIAGLHKKTCARAIPLLFNYENYQNVIDIVQKSNYNDQDGRIFILMNAPVLNTEFILHFQIPRIKAPGSYPFTFDRGYLTNLTGTIHVLDVEHNCLIFAHANWEGSKTPFPNLLLEIFASTASKMALSKLFRISGSPVD